MSEELETLRGKKLKLLVFRLRWLQENDLDCLIAVSSNKGMGKSTTSLQVIRTYIENYGLQCKNCKTKWILRKRICDKKPQLRDNVQEEGCPKCKTLAKTGSYNFKTHLRDFLAYDNRDVNDFFDNAPNYMPLSCDEGLKFALGAEWATSESKNLVKRFAIVRPKHHIIFLNIPKFSWLYSKYRNVMIGYWLRIITRGVIAVFKADEGEVDDPWYIDEIKKNLTGYNIFTSNEEITRKLISIKRKVKCFEDVIEIPPLPKDIYEKYLEWRKEITMRPTIDDEEDYEAITPILYNLINNLNEFIVKYDVMKKRGQRVPLTQIMDTFLRNPVTGEYVISRDSLTEKYKAFDKRLKTLQEAKIIQKKLEMEEKEKESKEALDNTPMPSMME